MKYFHPKHFLLIMVPLLFLIAPLSSSAESEEKKSEANNDSEIVINADSLSINFVLTRGH